MSICQNANGSQIVTLLLTSGSYRMREMLIEAIRRHGVTLKGSKHGSRWVKLFADHGCLLMTLSIASGSSSSGLEVDDVNW